MPTLFAFTPTETVPFLPNLAYQIVGISIVLGVLGALALVVALVGRVLGDVAASRPITLTTEQAPSALAPTQAEERLDPLVAAAIAAAVTVVLGRNARVIAVVTAESNVWSAEGRRTIFQSHRVR